MLGLTAQALSTVAVAASSGGTQQEDLRYYQAAVNLLPQEDGAYAGAVSSQHTIGGAKTVDVFLSRAATVACPDLSEDIATSTVQAESREARDPGPVVLDIGHGLDRASGHAVVDLVLTESPGCGEPETVTTLPAREVQVDVTGTTVRFFTGVSGTTSAGPDRSTGRFYDFSRDGTGTGARGDLSAELAPPRGLGVVFQDAIVHATTTGPPERATTISASSLTVELLGCGDGTTAVREVFVVGAGTGALEIAHRLESATASGSVELDRFTTDGCQGGQTVADRVVLPVTLNLVATTPMVRVSDTRWQVRPVGWCHRPRGHRLLRAVTTTYPPACRRPGRPKARLRGGYFGHVRGVRRVGAHRSRPMTTEQELGR